MLLDVNCILFHKLYADCLLLQIKCILCFLSSSNRWADVSTSVATIDSNSDGRMTSTRPSLLGATVATCIFCPSLLSYHCSNVLKVMDRLPMVIVTYGPLLQCMFIVVFFIAFNLLSFNEWSKRSIKSQ
jgi:hypothetical protein